VSSLDLDDVDVQGRTVDVLGKGRSERIRLTLPQETAAALQEWIEARGTDPGPLFTNYDRARKGHRLTGRSIHRIIGRLGQKVGLAVWPHGLRHAAITEALDLTNGNVRAVQRFSRHRSIQVLNLYDDSRKDMGGEIAQLVATGR